MKVRILAFVILLFAFISPSQAIFFSGELTTGDAIAQDPGYGEFYYDLYYLTVDAPMTIEVFMVPTQQFLPWVGYWDGDFSATPDYDTPPPELYDIPAAVGDQLYMIFDATPGIIYEIVAATYEYNPTLLGTYNFFITDPARLETGYWAGTTMPILDPQEVPAPASFYILLMGLATLLLVKNKPIYRERVAY